MVLRLDGDALARKCARGVLGQGLVKHGKNLGCDVVDSDLHQGDEDGVQFCQVFVDKVVQLGGKLDARGATADNGKVQEGAAVGLGEDGGARRVRALFEEGEDAETDAPGVANVAEEVGILADPRNTESLGVRPTCNDELVVGEGDGRALGRIRGEGGGRGRDDGLASEIIGRVGFDADGFGGEVDVVGPALVEVDARPWKMPDRFQY